MAGLLGMGCEMSKTLGHNSKKLGGVVINQCRNIYFGYQIKNTWIICTDLEGFITALSACSWWSIRDLNVINLFTPSSIKIKKIKSKKKL